MGEPPPTSCARGGHPEQWSHGCEPESLRSVVLDAVPVQPAAGALPHDPRGHKYIGAVGKKRRGHLHRLAAQVRMRAKKLEAIARSLARDYQLVFAPAVAHARRHFHVAAPSGAALSGRHPYSSARSRLRCLTRIGIYGPHPGSVRQSPAAGKVPLVTSTTDVSAGRRKYAAAWTSGDTGGICHPDLDDGVKPLVVLIAKSQEPERLMRALAAQELHNCADPALA